MSSLERLVAGASAVAALGAGVAWTVVSAYGNDVTVIDENGAWVYGLLAIPVAVALVPLFVRNNLHRATVTAAWVLTGFCLVTGMTVGSLYWPSALLMILAAFVGAWAQRRWPA